MTTSYMDDGSVASMMAVFRGTFDANPPFPPAVDIVCSGVKVVRDVAAVVTVLLGVGCEGADAPLYRRIYVVIDNNAEIQNLIRSRCAGAVAQINPEATQDVIERALQQRLHFLTPSCSEFDAIGEVLQDIIDPSAIVVANAARYLPSHPAEPCAPLSEHKTIFGENIRNVIEESEWSTTLAGLAEFLQPIAEKKNFFIVLLAGKYMPVLDENEAKLNAIKGAVWGSRRETDPEEHVITNVTRWQEMVALGNDTSAFEEVDATSLSALNRALIKAQCLFAAERSAEGFALIRPFLDEIRSDGSAATMATIARLALDVGEAAESISLLDAALAMDPNDEPTLRAIHQIARTMRANVQTEKAFKLLQNRFPNGSYTLTIAVERCLHRREYSRIIGLLNNHVSLPEVSEFFRYAHALAKGFAGPVPWPYESVIEHVAETAPASVDKAILHCAMHAVDNREFEVGLRLVLTNRIWDDVEAGAVVALIVKAIEKWAQWMPSQSDSKNEEDQAQKQKHERAFQVIMAALPFAFRYLAAHPEEQELRADLTNALDSKTMGSFGLGILIHFLSKAEVGNSPSTTPRESGIEKQNDSTSLTDDYYFEFVEKYIAAHGKRFLVLTPEPIPLQFLSEPLHALKDRAVYFCQQFAQIAGAEANDKLFLFVNLQIAIDLCQHLGQHTKIFDLLRTVIQARANAGMYQDARDWAEHALILLGSNRTDAQKRAAWLVFASAYSWCGNIHKAILGWLCAAEHRDIEIDPLQLGQDILLHSKLLRDAGLADEALVQLRRARQVFRDAGLESEMDNRVRHLEATISMMHGSRMNGQDIDAGIGVALQQRADAAIRSLRSALDADDDVYPPAALAAQVIAFYEEYGESVPNTLQELFYRALMEVSPNQAEKLQLLANAAPGRNELMTLSAALEKTRFSSDVDMDLRHVRLLARKALNRFVRESDTVGALIAIELLATHALRPNDPKLTPDNRQKESVLDDFRTAAAKRALETTHEGERTALASLLLQRDASDGAREPTTIAAFVGAPDALNAVIQKLGEAGIDIHALALNSQEQLVRLSSHKGAFLAPVEESVDTFDKEKLDEWRHDYPFCYCGPVGKEERKYIDEVEKSLLGIGITDDTVRHASLYVLDHELADVPPNLILVNGELAGGIGSIASTPSLSWLHATLHTPRSSNGRRTCWILPPDESGNLIVLRDNLADDLATRGFNMVVDVELPQESRGSDMVIVGAHGSIWFDKDTFRVISDEGTQVRYSMRDFAARLSNTAVVVLLVCSGGRLDRDIRSSGAIGLPYELLRRGCRAVVGSPWPVNVYRANQWGKHFIEQWDDGVMLIDAVRCANEQLRQTHPGESHFLAMHVMGNPLERKPC